MFQANNQKTTQSNGKRKRLSAVSFILTVGFLGLIAFTLFYVLTGADTAAYDETPSEPTVTDPPIVTEIPDAEGMPLTDYTLVTDYTSAADETPDSPDDVQDEQIYPDTAQYITITKDPSDIHRGYLILINHEHAYTFPEDIGLYRIADKGIASIRLQIQGFQLVRSIIEPLGDMMADYIAETGDTTVTVIAAYRSFATQQTMRDRHGTAAALPGHSEHHAGLAFDFGIFIGDTRSMFTGTGTTAWFAQNSYRYGYVLSFPADKTEITGTQYEPWHFRYVGLPHSYIMFQENFVLEEYIDYLRQYTFESPLTVERDGTIYEIYFTVDTEIRVPADTEFVISGNNVDGFIVTVSR